MLHRFAGKSETDVVERLAVGPEVGPEVSVVTPTKRQRRHSSPASPTTLTPVSSSGAEPPTPGDQEEEKYRVELEEDSCSGRKGTPTKVVLSGCKRLPLSPPARISMSAPIIVKQKFSAQKDKKLRGKMWPVRNPLMPRAQI